MKYIRTKDGKIYKIVDDFGTWTSNLISREIVEKALSGNEWFKGLGLNIIAQADTIEELCDEFVYNKQIFKTLKEALDYAPIGSEIYGAIWTDKGLIYVAKMNEKGKLKLL